MQVTLNIENDEQLRSYIKDLIKGQVLSIVREELKEMIQTELERKIKGFEKTNNEPEIEKTRRPFIKTNYSNFEKLCISMLGKTTESLDEFFDLHQEFYAKFQATTEEFDVMLKAALKSMSELKASDLPYVDAYFKST